MNVKVSKWGNSYAVRLPKSVIEQLSIHENTVLYLQQTEKGITLQKPSEKEQLRMMLSKIKKTTKEYDWGESIGKEWR